MSMNPHNGEIKAWVGGPNFKHFKYDMVKKEGDKWDLPLNLLFMLPL